MIEADVEPMEAPSDAGLNSVRELALEQQRTQARVDRLEQDLEKAKRDLSSVRDDRLPKVMTTLGMTSFTLADGSKVEVKDAYRCGQLDDLPDDDDGKKRPLTERLRALSWLDENQHGDLARRLITITLGADSAELAEELVALVKAHRSGNQLRITQARTVVWNTLAKFAREQTEQGENVPYELLGVTPARFTKITPPKEKE